MLPLKNDCCRLLEKNLEYLDVKSVLGLAYEYSEYKLIVSVEKYISNKESLNQDNINVKWQ